jgi:hypothetical protein
MLTIKFRKKNLDKRVFINKESTITMILYSSKKVALHPGFAKQSCLAFPVDNMQNLLFLKLLKSLLIPPPPSPNSLPDIGDH